jgi:hypothetical protein
MLTGHQFNRQRYRQMAFKSFMNVGKGVTAHGNYFEAELGTESLGYSLRCNVPSPEGRDLV